MHGFESAMLEKLKSTGFMQKKVQKGDFLKKGSR